MAVGIVAEYNPFHNGHKYQIDEIKKLNKEVVAIMSSSFVQRGEPAIFSKFERARLALLNGCDLVLELPCQYATGSADVFGKNAIELLSRSGIVEAVCFGVEAESEGERDQLLRLARLFENETAEFKEALKNALDEGCSYPRARQRAAETVMGTGLEGLFMPNNILAVEYLRNMERLSLKPLFITRKENEYLQDSLSGEISSATAIRKAIFEKNFEGVKKALPNGYEDLSVKDSVSIEDYADILRYLLKTLSADELSQIADITEGLENRILRCSDFENLNELFDNLKTKRYTRTKLQRAIIHIILGITKQMQEKSPEYIRVLGFRKEKEYLLGEMAKKASLPVITNAKNYPDLLKQEAKATDIYNIFLSKKSGEDFTTPIIVV